MKCNKVRYCLIFYMSKEYVQCLHDPGADLFNYEDTAVLRSMVCPFASGTDWIYKILHTHHKRPEKDTFLKL